MSSELPIERAITGSTSDPVVSYKYVVVRVPDDIDYVMALNGALYGLGQSFAWQQVGGDDTVEEAATIFRDTFDTMEFGTMPLGTMAYQDDDAVDINGGSIEGIRHFRGNIDPTEDAIFEQEGSALRLRLDSYGAAGTSIDLDVSKGTKAAQTPMLINEFTEVRFRSFDPAINFWQNYAYIRAQATENHGSGIRGAKIQIYTCPNGAGSPLVAMTIDQDKAVILEGNFRTKGTLFGIRNKAAIAAPSVTGSRGGNAALASLLTALDSQGFIVNNTTV